MVWRGCHAQLLFRRYTWKHICPGTLFGSPERSETGSGVLPGRSGGLAAVWGSEQRDRIQATAYNAGLLSTYPGAIHYLRNLPLVLEGDDFTVVHHSPFALPPVGQAVTIACFAYLDDAALRHSLDPWRNHRHRLIFSGHDHLPAVFELPGQRSSEPRAYRPRATECLTVRLRDASRYWIKVGSVGGPYRDHTAVANSALYDSERQTVTLFRLPYPTQALRLELESHTFLSELSTLRRYRELLTSPVSS
jgi:hypothetical protein